MSSGQDARLLAELEDSDGRVTPQQVLEAAREPSHAWHGRFVWDDTAAAELYRLTQARTLIRSVKYEVRISDRVVRSVSYVHDPDAERGEAGYVSVASLRSDEERARSAIIAEFARVSSALRRARELATVLGLGGEIDAMTEQVAALSERVRAEDASTGAPAQ